MRYIVPLLVFAGCAPQAQEAGPTVDWSYETAVDPDSVAGDVRGVTGRVDRMTVQTDAISPRPIDVWLPSTYAEAPDRHYPVLYMHDGQNVFDPEKSGYSGWDWGVDEAMTALDMQAIVVAVHSVEATRFADYFPQKAEAEFGGRVRADYADIGERPLSADAYLDYLINSVKPRIDATYRTLSGSAHTSIMGSSMGGLISLYAISEYPDVFGQAAMVSPHFPLGDGALVDYFADRLPDPATHRLYFDHGTHTLDHNYKPYQDRLDIALTEAGYERGRNWMTRTFEGHDHSERAWRNRVHIPLQFLLEPET